MISLKFGDVSSCFSVEYIVSPQSHTVFRLNVFINVNVQKHHSTSPVVTDMVTMTFKSLQTLGKGFAKIVFTKAVQ